MPGVVNLRSQWRPLTLPPSSSLPSKLAPHGPPSTRLAGLAFVAPALGVYLPPVAFAVARLAAPAVAPAAPAVARTPEPLPAGPTSLLVMTGTGAAVARAIVVLSSSPGSPGLGA